MANPPMRTIMAAITVAKTGLRMKKSENIVIYS
jgi:hypothetical protein